MRHTAHDPEGGEPEYDLPYHPEWDDPQWVRWKVDQMGTLALHPIEVLDNMADWAHLGPVHGETVKYFENEFNGHICRQIQGGGHRTLVTSTGLLETDTWYTGPGILHSRLLGLYPTIMQQIFVRQSLLQRAATPADIANVITFLASDEAAFVTGQVISIDGGLRAHLPTTADMAALFANA